MGNNHNQELGDAIYQFRRESRMTNIKPSATIVLYVTPEYFDDLNDEDARLISITGSGIKFMGFDLFIISNYEEHPNFRIVHG